VQSNEPIGQDVEFQGKMKGNLVIIGLVIADQRRVDPLLFPMVGPFANQSPRREELPTKINYIIIKLSTIKIKILTIII
jgi:hypothetical protein